MQRLESEQAGAARQVISLPFVTGDPYGTPFSPTVEERLLLFPTDSFMLTSDQFNALRSAAVALAEEQAYITVVEDWRDESHVPSFQGGIWQISLNDPSSYFDLPNDALFDALQNSIFSARGRWGVLTAADDFALVGGTSAFVRNMRGALSQRPEDMTADWLDYWVHEAQDGRSVTWVVRLLKHVYGPEHAEQILASALPLAATDLFGF